MNLITADKLNEILQEPYKDDESKNKLIELFDKKITDDLVRRIILDLDMAGSLYNFYDVQFQNGNYYDKIEENNYFVYDVNYKSDKIGKCADRLIEFFNNISEYQFNSKLLQYENVNKDAQLVEKYGSKSFMAFYYTKRPKTPHLDELVKLINFSYKIEDFIDKIYMPYATEQYINQQTASKK